MTDLIWPIVGFISGSIPFSYLAGRFLAGKDVRREGSGNVGATNVFRVAGRTAGAAAALGDVVKSLLPVLAVRLAGGAPAWQAATAAGVVLGHCYSPFLAFKGGKGVISTITVAIVLCWQAALVFAVVWLACFLLSGYVSLSSLLGAAALPVAALAFRAHPAITLFLGLAAVFVLWKHRANVGRLIAGTESRMLRRSR